MPLLTLTELRAMFAIDASVDDIALASALATAEAEAQVFVGDQAYTDAQSGSPQNPQRRAALRLAVPMVAMAYALPFLSLRVAGNGIAQSLGTPGAYRVSDVSFREIQARQAAYLKEADRLTRPYFLEGVAGFEAGFSQQRRSHSLSNQPVW